MMEEWLTLWKPFRYQAKKNYTDRDVVKKLTSNCGNERKNKFNWWKLNKKIKKT